MARELEWAKAGFDISQHFTVGWFFSSLMLQNLSLTHYVSEVSEQESYAPHRNSGIKTDGGILIHSSITTEAKTNCWGKRTW